MIKSSNDLLFSFDDLNTIGAEQVMNYCISAMTDSRFNHVTRSVCPG